MPPACARRATGNSVGPQINISQRPCRNLLAVRNVRDLQAAGFSAHMSSARTSRLPTPRRGLKQLDLVGHYQWPELRSETLNEVLVRKHACRVRAQDGVVLELPQMYVAAEPTRQAVRRSFSPISAPERLSRHQRAAKMAEALEVSTVGFFYNR